jgi:LAS superfamily LD-carboxypeptidase LdcB
MMKTFFFLGVFFLTQTTCFAQNYFITIYEKDFLLGKISYENDRRFVKISDAYSGKVGTAMYLLEPTYQAFVNMSDAAKKDGVSLKIVSAGRNFQMQKGIWERKWNARRANFKSDEETASDILKFSSMPGTSRHHWGTDLDINSVDPAYFQSGKGKRELEWLELNAGRFGFCKTYNDKALNGRTGYSEEDWHWSFLPLSIGIMKQYTDAIELSDITGFLGSNTAMKLNVIDVYVKGIASDCYTLPLNYLFQDK